MGQPATAAIVVGCIFIGLFSVYASYRIYVKWYWNRHGDSGSAPLPPIREPPSAYAVAASSGSPPATGTLYGETWRNSWRGSASKASLTASSHLDSLPYSRRLSANNALLVHPGGEYSSAPASPLSVGTDSPLAALPTSPSEAYDHTRGISSNSSTNALKRNYASSLSPSSGGIASSADLATSPIKRSSYLPHLPSNRETINIVPPQPLGFGGFGSMATATDQRTLAFSKVSGIGSGDDDFATGLVWDGSSGGVNEFGVAGGTAHLREEERLRYLAQGPGRSSHNGSTRASSVAGGMPASNSHLLYAPNGEGWRTPDMPSSRSISPSQAAWDVSSDNSSSPRTSKALPAHPLESANDVSRRSSPAIDATASGSRLANAFTNMQSPLQLMSSPQPSEGHHGRHYSDVDTLMTAGTHHSNGEPNSGVLGTSHDTGSPILGAFGSISAPPAPPRSVATPDLTSRSASGTGSGSHSSPTTGPPTESSLSVSGRPSAASGLDDEGLGRGRVFAVGKDGLLALGPAAHDLEASSGTADVRKEATRRSWGLSTLIGGKA